MRPLNRTLFCALALTAVLGVGCGGDPLDPVVSVCLKAAKDKLNDPHAQIDEESMRTSVVKKDDGTWEVGGIVWFERGLQGERKQTIACHARAADSGKGEPQVTLLQFLW